MSAFLQQFIDSELLEEALEPVTELLLFPSCVPQVVHSN